MNKIDPTLYITDVDPRAEAIMDASGWYKTETSTVAVVTDAAGGGTSGEVLWLIAQGWRITSQSTSSEKTVIAESAVVSGTAYDNSSSTEYLTLYTQTYSLERKILDPEKALSALIPSFTSAYNEGRELNDSRYDELVILYSLMSTEGQDELIGLEADDVTYDALIEVILTAANANSVSTASDLSSALDGYGASMINRINVQFDNEVEKLRSALTSRGMFNTTVFDSTTAGIERERAVALADVDDKLIIQNLDLKAKIYSIQEAMSDKLIASRDRLHAIKSQGKLGRLEVREKVLSALYAFMERREDGYPDLGSIANMVHNLGVSTAGQSGE